LKLSVIVNPAPNRELFLPKSTVSWIRNVARVAGVEWNTNLLGADLCHRMHAMLTWANIRLSDPEEADRYAAFMDLLDLGRTLGLRLDYELGEVR
jgi:hypothetical protein